MNLQATSFCSADIERYGMGAGIVPMATRPEDAAVCFLLGRERWMPSWKGSCRWSGFEGSRKDHENMFVTASREFDEESMGSCRECGREEVQCRMRDGDFWIRVVLRIVNEHRRNAHRYHSTHVMRIDWDESIPQRFQETRAKIEYIDRLVQELRHTRPVVLHDLIDVGDIVDDDDATSSGACTVHHRGTRAEPQEDEPCRETTVVTDPKEVEEVRAWRLVRDRLERALAPHAHACVHARREPTSQHVTDVHVSKDFLEKDQVRWWTMDELIEVIRNRGTYGNERFRPYFLPVLQTILNEHAREFDTEYDPQWAQRGVGAHVDITAGAAVTALAATGDGVSLQPMNATSRQRSLAPWKSRPPPSQPRPPPCVHPLAAPPPDQDESPSDDRPRSLSHHETPSGTKDLGREEEDELEDSSPSSSSPSSSPLSSPWRRQGSTAWQHPQRRLPWSPTWHDATQRRGGRHMLHRNKSDNDLAPPPPPPFPPLLGVSNSPRPRRWHRTRPRELAWTSRDRGARSRSAP